MPQSFIDRWLADRFLDRLAASPRGRTYLITQLVDAEEGDEAGVFDHLVARVQDAELNDLVRKHRDDELRHARVFRDCLARQSTAPVPRPPGVIQFIDRELGGFMRSFVDNRQTVMEAYVLLQVIEERGVEQYPRFACALAPYDAETARVIEEVVRDEERHVKYAKAISKRYAPDEHTHAAALQRFRAAEERAFREQGHEFLAQAIDADLLAVGRIERAGWRALSSLAGRMFVAGVTVRNQPLVVERAEHASRAS